MLITKGAPEGVLAISTAREADGLQHPLDEAERERCTETYRALSADGFRVLAVAYRPVERREGLTAADENDLIFAGFVTFFDPPQEDVAATLAALRRDGIEVKIVTGDNELVTRHICEKVGIDAESIVLGEEIERMGDAALAHVAEEVNVFARVSPGQKNRIIRALKARSHVVGFLGDGINDAPSLHAADVGISVAGAVDVAKDAADIILLEHNLDVLHSGIIEGRKAFGNVFKYLLMGTSSNFGNMFSMAGAVLFLPFLPMLPTQILLNNFLYDLAQVTIPTDNVDPAYIRKPQRWDVPGDPEFHALDRPDQLNLRLPDLLHPAQGLQVIRGAVPHRMVRRIAGDANAGVVYHPNRRQSLEQSAEPASGRDHRAGSFDRRAVAVLSVGRSAGLHTVARRLLRLPDRGHSHLSGAGRNGEAKIDTPPARMIA